MLINKYRIKKAIRSPFGAIIRTFGYEKFKWISDENYLKIMFKYYMKNFNGLNFMTESLSIQNMSTKLQSGNSLPK